MNEEHPLRCLLLSIASNPILSLFALVFLVQAYTMINHLEKVNETLVKIHEDNVVITNYIEAEMTSTTEYVKQINELDDKTNEILLLIRGGKLNEK